MTLILPNHLGVIIDGNRRWAEARGLPLWEGYRIGAEKLDKFLNWCLEIGIPQISVYTLSIENLTRSKKELKHLFNIIEQYLDNLLNNNNKFSLLERYEVKVRFIGELNILPKSLIKITGKLMEKTAKYQKKILKFLDRL
jgi:undecaprenyl diphosphate synthase